MISTIIQGAVADVVGDLLRDSDFGPIGEGGQIGTLGPVTFTASAQRVRTFQAASLKSGARWAQHVVHLRKPVQEFEGPELQTLSLPIRLDAMLGVKPREELERLREACETGEVLQFVLGERLVGDFVIEDVDEGWTTVDNRGNILVAAVSLSLKEYQ